MSSLLGTAFLLGLLFNATPGAVFAETLRRGVSGGFRPALAVQLGSLSGDALWAVLGLCGVGLLLQVELLRLPIGLAGAGYLLWLARDAWRAAGRATADSGYPAPRSAAGSGVMLSLTNPQNIAFWAALGSALGGLSLDNPQALDYAVFLVGFLGASVVWSFTCAAAAELLARRLGPRWTALTHRFCALLLLVLALAALRDLTRVHSNEADHREAAETAAQQR